MLNTRLQSLLSDLGASWDASREHVGRVVVQLYQPRSMCAPQFNNGRRSRISVLIFRCRGTGTPQSINSCAEIFEVEERDVQGGGVGPVS